MGKKKMPAKDKVAIFTTIGFLSCASLLAYVDRTNMGIAIVPMGDENEWSARTRGSVLGAFFFGYIWTQILGGWLSDSIIGGGPVLLVAFSLWSCVLLSTPTLTKEFGLKGAVAARVALGLVEGFCFPAVHSVIPRVSPAEWLNGSLAVVSGLTYLGGVLSLLAAAPLAAYRGWPAIFYAAGSVGLLWCIGWAIFIFTRGPPELFMWNPVNLRKNGKMEKKSPVWTLVTASPVWAMFTCNYCNCWGFWLIMTWLPTYFRETFEASLEDLGSLSVLPYVTQGLIGLGLGFSGDYVMRRGWMSKRVLRNVSQSIAMAGAAGLLVALHFTRRLVPAVALVTAAMSVNAFSSVGLNMNHIDLAPRHAGFLYGMLNTIGILPGVIGVPLTGWMLEGSGYNWDGVFALAATHYVIGLVVFLIFGSFNALLF